MSVSRSIVKPINTAALILVFGQNEQLLKNHKTLTNLRSVRSRRKTKFHYFYCKTHNKNIENINLSKSSLLLAMFEFVSLARFQS